MRRLLTITICSLLMVALCASVAFAGNGKGRESAPGQIKKSDVPAVETSVGETSSANPGNSGRGKAKGHDEDSTNNADGQSGEATGTATRSKNASGTAQVVRERQGIENAADRIAGNIAKAEKAVADGKKKQVPPGLQKVLEKFLGWLGVTPEPDASEETTPDVSVETTPAE